MKDKPVVAVDLGGTKIRSALISPDGKLLVVDNRFETDNNVVEKTSAPQYLA